MTSGFSGTWATVVGVVEDVRVYGLTDETAGARYQLYRQTGIVPEGNTLVVRVSGDPGALAGAVRSAVHAVDPRVAIYGVGSHDPVAFVGAALLLATAGALSAWCRRCGRAGPIPWSP